MRTIVVVQTIVFRGLLRLVRQSCDQSAGLETARRSVLRPGRPIENRPQAKSLPHISSQAVKILQASSTGWDHV